METILSKYTAISQNRTFLSEFSRWGGKFAEYRSEFDKIGMVRCIMAQRALRRMRDKGLYRDTFK